MSRIPEKICTVDECERVARSGVNDYCEMHYYRLRRTGTTDKLPPPRLPEAVRAARRAFRNERRRLKRHEANPDMQTRQHIAGKACTAESCDKPMEVGRTGYCRMHDRRLKTRGDLGFEMQGETHPAWTGDAATYFAVHQRLRSQRGSASSWCCADCSNRAAQWSYDHADHAQRVDPDAGPFSTDLNHYAPRCVPCHKRFDLQRIAAERAS